MRPYATHACSHWKFRKPLALCLIFIYITMFSVLDDVFNISSNMRRRSELLQCKIRGIGFAHRTSHPASRKWDGHRRQLAKFQEKLIASYSSHSSSVLVQRSVALKIDDFLMWLKRQIVVLGRFEADPKRFVWFSCYELDCYSCLLTGDLDKGPPLMRN